MAPDSTADSGAGFDAEFDEALDEALALPADERLTFIESRFADRRELARRLRELLEAAQAGSDLLARADRAARDVLAEAAQPADADRDGGSADGDRDEPVPERIGDYRIVDRLGSGGMGTVYLAERLDGEVDRKVALKVVTAGAYSRSHLDRFLAERRMLARLEHPNIARLYDVGVDASGVPFLVMEYVDGQPIDAWADERRLGVEERLGLVLQVAEALSCAHRNLIVHRDVKPNNLLVTDDGVVKLLDFGVAKLLEDPDLDAPPLTRPGLPLLTPEYASPEQIRGELVTTASDVYATGILLHEMLTGSRPYAFESRSPVHIEQVVTDQEPRVPSRAAASISPEAAALRSTSPDGLARALRGDLDAIVLQALQKEPGGRYGSIQEFAADITRHRTHEPVAARPPTWRYRAGRFVRRNRLQFGAAALVVLALVGGLGATWWQGRLAAREAERAERVVELLTGLFQGSDPDAAPGRELTARELLARGEGPLLAGLGDEPEVALRLQRVLGRIYTSIGEYDRALPLLDSARVLADRTGSPEDRSAARSALADLLHARGEYAAGEAVAREHLELRRMIDRGETVELATALTNLASFIHRQGRYEEAEAVLREGLAMDRRVGGPAAVATDLNNLGTLLLNQSRYDEAIEILAESASIRRGLYVGYHTDVATSIANLANAFDRKGDQEGADSLYAEALEMRRQLLGEEHPHVAVVLNNLAQLRQAQGRFDESRALHQDALRIRRAVFGDDHAQVAASLNNLAIVSYREGDYDGAEASMREAVSVFRANLAEDHPNVLTGVANLGAILRAKGELAQAETLIRETLETRLRVLGPDHHNTGGSWSNLADLLLRQGRVAEAEEPSARALAIYEAVLDPSHSDLESARRTRGRVLIELDRADEAVELLRLSCANAEERLETDHPTLNGCRASLGLALLATGDAASANELLSGALPILEEARPDDVWTQKAREALDRLSGS